METYPGLILQQLRTLLADRSWTAETTLLIEQVDGPRSSVP